MRDEDEEACERLKKKKQQQEQQEEPSDEKKTLTAEDIKTCPFDPRFPNTDQTNHCYVSFIDFQRCTRLLGEDFAGCEHFKLCYTALCPNEWIEKWYNQLEEGTFAGRIYPPKPKEGEPPPPPPPHYEPNPKPCK